MGLGVTRLPRPVAGIDLDTPVVPPRATLRLCGATARAEPRCELLEDPSPRVSDDPGSAVRLDAVRLDALAQVTSVELPRLAASTAPSR